MFRENVEVFKRVSVFLDAVILAACFFAAFFLKQWIGNHYSWDLLPFSNVLSEAPASLRQHVPMLILSVLLWVTGLYFNGMHGSLGTKSLPNIGGIVVLAAFYNDSYSAIINKTMPLVNFIAVSKRNLILDAAYISSLLNNKIRLSDRVRGNYSDLLKSL